MMKKRGLAIMVSAFAVALLGGVAVAQIADVLPGSDDAPAEAPMLAAEAENDGTGESDVVKDERREAPKDDRSRDEEPADRPKDEPPSDEPKDEPPSDEPKDEELPRDEETDTTPPEFVILSPEDGAHVDDTVITVSGEVEPGATVTFADRYEAKVTEQGHWWIALKLERGENVFTLYATDAAGNTSSDSVTVYLDTATDHRFTAHQKWEIVDGHPAANKYYGTATPGTYVYIVSAKGGAETRVEAGTNGEWDAYVEFPKAPCNEWFGVVVETDGGRKTFEMKWVCERDHEFTAHQKWEVVDGHPAANIYHGTGVPGSSVWILSTKGGAEKKVAVGENGGWEAHVEFPKATCNAWLDVVVEGEGGRKVFEMKYVCADGGGDVDFSAHQQYGSCEEPIPYDVFWGTEDPGTKIHVESKYGSGWTKANDHGEWELRVEFPDAPVGKKFEVVVESDDGGRKVFTFIRTAAGDK